MVCRKIYPPADTQPEPTVTDNASTDGEHATAAELLAAEIKRFRAAAGLSQRQLAVRSGYTREYVSMAERPGNIPSRDLVRALDSALDAAGALVDLRAQAKAEQQSLRYGLQVDSSSDRPASTLRRAATVGPANLDVTAGAVAAPVEMPRLESLRRSVLGCVANREPTREVSTARLQKRVAEAHQLYQQADYDNAAQLLPSLIGSLEGSTGFIPANLKAVTYLAAAKLATKMGDAGLAWVAADRSLRHANDTDHHGLIAIASYQVACALLKNGHFAEATETATQAEEQLASHTGSTSTNNPDAISARGALLLLLAIMSARQGDGPRARHNLHDALKLANQLGQDSNWLWTAFGPTNIAIHELAVHVALGDTRTTLQLGESIDVDALPTVLRGRRSQVHLELSWAAVGQGDDSLAVLHLLEAERVAQQTVSRNSTARVLLSTLITRERRGATPGLRALAVRAGVA